MSIYEAIENIHNEIEGVKILVNFMKISITWKNILMSKQVHVHVEYYEVFILFFEKIKKLK